MGTVTVLTIKNYEGVRHLRLVTHKWSCLRHIFKARVAMSQVGSRKDSTPGKYQSKSKGQEF
jgi:hypothetical protein